LIRWVRGWLPDNAVTVQYQVEGDWVFQALLGEIPPDFQRDIRASLLPFRKLVVSQGSIRLAP